MKSLSEQLADTKAVIDAAKEASAKKGQDALKKGAKPAAKAPPAQASDTGSDDDDDDLPVETPAAPATSAQAPAVTTPSLFAD